MKNPMRSRDALICVLAVLLLLGGTARAVWAQEPAAPAAPVAPAVPATPPVPATPMPPAVAPPIPPSAAPPTVAPPPLPTVASDSADSLPSSVDEALAVALQNNADILLAKANLRAAEAQLNKTRLEVARNVADAYADYQAKKEGMKKTEQMAAQGIAGPSNLADAKAAVAQAEGSLRYVLGGDARSNVRDVAVLPTQSSRGSGKISALPPQAWERRPRPELRAGDLSPSVRALQTTLTADFTNSKLSEITEYISTSFEVPISVDPAAASEVLSVGFHQGTFAQLLQFLADASSGDLCFIIRDYGIFATTIERAQCIEAPTIPSDVPLYVPVGTPQSGAKETSAAAVEKAAGETPKEAGQTAR